MGYVVRFFEWIFKVLSKAYEWASGIGGKIILFVTTMFSSLAGVVSYIKGHFSDIARMFDYGTSAVQSAGETVSSNQTYSMFAYCTSIDVAINYIVSIGGIFLGCVGVIIIAFFSYVVVAFIFPLIFNAVLKVISLFSGGFVKP